MRFRDALIIMAAVLTATVPAQEAVEAQGMPGPRPPIPGGITDKPYLKNFTGGIALGGYMDHELLIREGSSTFDQHRYIPFIFAQPVDYIHVAAEIEFEHGGLVKSGRAAGIDTDGDRQIDEVSNKKTDPDPRQSAERSDQSSPGIPATHPDDSVGVGNGCVRCVLSGRVGCGL